jgi:Tfp pilus assembly ATPase PilU
MNIFIPVLFICANSVCEFQQATSHFYRIEDCVIAVETQRNFIINTARAVGLDVEVQATCVAANVKTII